MALSCDYAVLDQEVLLAPFTDPEADNHGKDCGIAFADSAPIPRMQAVNNGGQDIKKGASIPKMTPAQTPSGPTSSGSRQGSNSQTAKPGGDKKK